MMLFPDPIILTLISIVHAATIEPSYLEVVKMSKSQLNVDGLASSMQNNNSVQNNNLPPSLHTYPTYPEYVSNIDTVSVITGYEGYLEPKETALQKTSQLSYENIFFSLIPFLNSLSLYSARVGTFLLQLLMVILVGVASTSLICTYTSICKSFTEEKTKDFSRVFITPENLDIATAVVGKALKKYNFT